MGFLLVLLHVALAALVRLNSVLANVGLKFFCTIKCAGTELATKLTYACRTVSDILPADVAQTRMFTRVETRSSRAPFYENAAGHKWQKYDI